MTEQATRQPLELQNGHIHLFDIYKYVAEHPKYPSHEDGDLRPYTTLLDKIVKDIPDHPGWYNWGHVNEVGFWLSIYVGKSTTSVKNRIKKELDSEKQAFWATVYGMEPVASQFDEAYNQDGTRPDLGKRGYRKRGGIHFIVWVSAQGASNEVIQHEENALIALYRPAVNVQRFGLPKLLQGWEDLLHEPYTTKQIVERFETEIENVTNPLRELPVASAAKS
jgi:hypothetical protein